jgi:hypothetical protein
MVTKGGGTGVFAGWPCEVVHCAVASPCEDASQEARRHLMRTFETLITALETLGMAAIFVGWLATVFLFVLE